MIPRDSLGIIGQQQPDGSIDFGDGCFKSCMANIAGLEHCPVIRFQRDDGKIVRHPTGAKWSNPDLTSRDQLIVWIAACHFDSFNYIAWFTLKRNYYFQYRINKDLLIDPSIRWFMRYCAGNKSYSWLGDKFLRLNIWWASKTDHEIHQLLVMAWVLGYLDYFCTKVPDWENRLCDYWDGWRGQPEISNALILKIKKELGNG